VILVDDRAGSDVLCEQLTKLGVEAELTRLPSGDVAFEGRGTGGTLVDVGIEFKKLPDLVASIRTGRLAGLQMVNMLGPTGAFHYGWLLIEGRYDVDKSGQMVIYQGRARGWRPLPAKANAVEIEKRLLTMELCGGCHVRFANTRDDTLRFIVTLYRWFTDKAMDEHQSHVAQHRPFGFLPISDFRDVVSRFPGVGLKTSLAVETHFGGNLRRAVNAGVEDWASIVIGGAGKARRLGTVAATHIVSFCRGTFQ
jgi:ERCC4-type nuclease